MNIVPIDIVFAVIFLILTIRCVFRGFVAEFMTIQAVVGGLILAFIFSPRLAVYLDELMKPSRWNHLISFLVIFLVIYLVFKILERILAGFFERLNLEKLDRSLGLFLGIVEGALALFLIVYVIDIQPLIDADRILGGSVVAKWIHALLPEGSRFVSDSIGTLI